MKLKTEKQKAPPKIEYAIRPAAHGDIDAMADLLAELFSIEEDFTADAVRQKCGLELMLNGDNSRKAWVAATMGKVIGMISIQTLASTAEGGEVGLIEDLIVAEIHRGNGIGTSLITAVESWAEERGLLRLQLLADCNNEPALAFYKKSNWLSTRLVCLRKMIPK